MTTIMNKFSYCDALTKHEKINWLHLTNLSSNEAHHPAYASIMDNFLQQYKPIDSTRYPGFKIARQAVATFHNLDENQIMLAPGSDFAINLAVNALGKFYNGLITHEPNYIGYKHYAILHQLPFTTCPTFWQNLFLNKTLDLLQKKKKHIFALSNPEGFLGSCLTFTEIQAIANVCYDNDHLLIIDEAYAPFNDFDHLPLVRNNMDNIIILRSFSKGLGMANLRVAAIFSDSNIINYMRKFASENCISGFSLDYLTYALTKKSDLLTNITSDVKKFRDHICHDIKKEIPQLNPMPSKTNFIAIDPGSSFNTSLLIQKMLDNKFRLRQLIEIPDKNHFLRLAIPAPKKYLKLMLHLKNFIKAQSKKR